MVLSPGGLPSQTSVVTHCSSETATGTHNAFKRFFHNNDQYHFFKLLKENCCSNYSSDNNEDWVLVMGTLRSSPQHSVFVCSLLSKDNYYRVPVLEFPALTDGRWHCPCGFLFMSRPRTLSLWGPQET